MEKLCTTCGENKTATLFSKNKRTKDGLQTKCKECVSKYYLLTRERQLARAQEWNLKKKDMTPEEYWKKV